MRASAPIIAAALAFMGSPPPVAAGSGMIFVTNERSNTISVLDSGHEVVETIETCSRPRGVHFSADRSRFFVGCADDDQIAIYDTETHALVGRITGVEEPETFDLHPDGRRLYVSNEEDATATVYDVATGREVRRIAGNEGRGVGAVVLSPDARLLALVIADHTIRLWDLDSGQECPRCRGHTEGVLEVVFAPDGRRLASSDWATVRVWDTATSREVARFHGPERIAPGVPNCAFAADGRLFAWSWGQEVYLHDLAAAGAQALMVLSVERSLA